MRTHNHLLVWWLGIMAFGFCSFSLLVSGKEPLQARLETLDQYSRIQIPITSGSGFRIVSGKKGEVSLTIERVATNALTALPGMVDSRIQKVQVKELGLDRAEITIQFRDSKMESFAYAQGNNLVLDL